MNPSEELDALATNFVLDAERETGSARGEESTPTQAGTLAGKAQPPTVDIPFYKWQEIVSRAPTEYIVEDVVQADALGTIFGPSGVGKTHFCLDLCFCIACGLPWFGYDVHARPVTYVAREASGGLTNRLRALELSYPGTPPANILFVLDDVPFNLFHSDDIDRLVARIRDEGCENGLIVFDTFAAAAAGIDENSGKDMTVVIANLQLLKKETGCTVIIVHHTGKTDGKGMRGHSSMHAAMDFVIELRRDGTQRYWTLLKSREGADGGEHTFRLQTVQLGLNLQGKELSSCIIDSDTPALPKRPPSPGGTNQKKCLEHLATLFAASKDVDVESEAPRGRTLLKFDDAVAAMVPVFENEQTHRKSAVIGTLKAMVKRGFYGLSTDEHWLWEIGERKATPSYGKRN